MINYEICIVEDSHHVQITKSTEWGIICGCNLHVLKDGLTRWCCFWPNDQEILHSILDVRLTVSLYYPILL